MPRCLVLLVIGLLALPANAGERPIPATREKKPGYAPAVGTGGQVLQPETAVRRGPNLELAAMKKKKGATSRPMSAEGNKKAGEAFLAENRTKQGVVVLPSGLQYEVLKEGGGKIPTDVDTVECLVRATFVDGKVFGSSPRGKPSVFNVKGTIPGLNEALKLMKAGSKWRIVIPPGLAYGEKGAGRAVGPNETLIYEVELLAVR